MSIRDWNVFTNRIVCCDHPSSVAILHFLFRNVTDFHWKGTLLYHLNDAFFLSQVAAKLQWWQSECCTSYADAWSIFFWEYLFACFTRCSLCGIHHWTNLALRDSKRFVRLLPFIFTLTSGCLTASRYFLRYILPVKQCLREVYPAFKHAAL